MDENIHHYNDLIKIFNDCFFESHNTRLVRGSDEPLYLPKDENRPHNEIYFAHGFFASALHESAHWLIAGEKRRQLIDFGYWYSPDGRTNEQQTLFQSVEIKPQALEWILSKAASFPFRISVDNLNGPESDTLVFKRNVYNQVKTYCEQGLPSRAKILRLALCSFYGTSVDFNISDFAIETM
ncbi:MAG: elongation factor P hydroxylase [Parachlamydiaceae bacterium]|nr:elongation factor P hydroxylase [Parachlamydiaceae bacterium]